MSRAVGVRVFLAIWLALAAEAWPIAFTKTSKSMPSVEVRLAPPEDPLPQVSASIQQLERQRMR